MSWLYAACHAGGEGAGIACFRFDSQTGFIEPVTLFRDGLARPLFVQAAPDASRLYVADNLAGVGTVAALARDATGELSLLGSQPAGGAVPCYVGVHPTGRAVLAASYSGGTVAAWALDERGNLIAPGQVIDHHREPGSRTNPHCFVFDPTGCFALAADLGRDQVLVYRVHDHPTGAAVLQTPAVSALDLPPRAGPRHLCFSPDRRWVYVIHEYANAVTVARWSAAAGVLEATQTISTRPADATGKSYAADIVIHPTGRFVFASNRGDHTVAVFTVDADTGRLHEAGRYPCGGDWPRGLAMDRSGRWLLVANERSSRICAMGIDPATGAPSEVVCKVEAAEPACLTIVP